MRNSGNGDEPTASLTGTLPGSDAIHIPFGYLASASSISANPAGDRVSRRRGSNTDLTGEVLSGYTVAEELARGGMGTVYLAEHVLLGHKAAIKVINAGHAQDHTVVARFFHEAKAASMFDHPGIVKVFDFGKRQDGTSFLIMELIAGESLRQRMQRIRRMPLHQALELTRHMACALAAAHTRGVIHRDLKPDNVMIVPDPALESGERIKILDFGIAKFSQPPTANAVTAKGITLGTPTYMAPEQCEDPSAIDHRADLYALGCILFHMLCGQPPFRGRNSFEISSAHKMTAPPHPSEIESSIDRETEALILRLLDKDPDARVQSTGELVEMIDGLLAARRPSSKRPADNPPGQPELPPKAGQTWYRRRWPAAPCVIAVCLASILSLVACVGM